MNVSTDPPDGGTKKGREIRRKGREIRKHDDGAPDKKGEASRRGGGPLGGVSFRGNRIGVFDDGVAVGSLACVQALADATSCVGRPDVSRNAARAPS